MKRAAILLAAVLALPVLAQGPVPEAQVPASLDDGVVDWLKAYAAEKDAQLEIGFGQTRWERTPNTQYWQREFPNSFDLISPAYFVGVSYELTSGASDAWYDWGHDGIRASVGFLDLGNMRSEALATSDVNYKEGVGCINPCPILGKWDVNSRIKGVEFAVKPQWVFGETKVFAKVGVLVHRPRIDVKIYRGPNDTSRTHYNYPEQLNFSPSLGVGVERGPYWCSLNYLRVDATTDTTEEDKRIPPGFGNNVVTALCGVAIK